MISKIDTPKTEGSKVYDNKGTTAALVNYLVSSEEKLGGNGEFFNFHKEGISADQAQKMIDSNVKGLKASETKFISMTINPSHEELLHISNNRDKMKLFVRTSMKNYAENFKNGDPVQPSQLVWCAIVHEHRYFTNSDKAKFEKLNPGLKFRFRTEEEVLNFKKINPDTVCPFEVQARKPGNNMHAHIIVSKRDEAMKRSLTPHGKKDSFPIMSWQRKNQDSFQMLFDFKKGQNLYKEMQLNNISRFVNDINDRKGSVIDLKHVLNMAERGEESGKVLSNIKQLNMDLYRSKNIEDPYRYIEIGPKLYWKENQIETIKEDNIVVKKDFNSTNDFGLFNNLIHDLDNINNQLDHRPAQRSENQTKRKRKKRRPDL